MKYLIVCALLASLLAIANAHTWQSGLCPIVPPIANFEMNRFLGRWFVIQKTSTASRCISYNYTRGSEPGEYLLTQDSHHPVIDLTPVKHGYHYTGVISVPEPSTSARMEVRFPMSVAGSASHVVFATDYVNYAAIFTCQKIVFGNRHSATILSRRKDLEPSKINEIRVKLGNYEVDPYELSIVPQTNCQSGDDPLDININPNTFSAENFGNIVRKAGEKLGDGVEWITNAGSKVYKKIVGSDTSSRPTTTTQRVPPADVVNMDTNEVEWIP